MLRFHHHSLTVRYSVAGLPVEMFITVASIHIVIQFYNHNSIVKKSVYLLFMIAPSQQVHHGVQDVISTGILHLCDLGQIIRTFQVELDEVLQSTTI